MGRLKERIGWFVSEVERSWAPVDEAPPVPIREVFRRFWPYAKPYRRWLPVILLLAVLGPAIEAATIWLFKLLVDEVLVPRDFSPLIPIALAYLGLTVLGGALSFCDEYLSDWVGEKFILSLRERFFQHLHGLSPSFFERRKLGDVMSRLSGDVNAIEELMLSGIASTLSYVFQLVFFVGALFYLQWNLALISLFVAPLFWFLARYFSGKIQDASREQRRRNGSINAVAEESLSNSAIVQAYNLQDKEAERFGREARGSFRAYMAATRLQAVFSPLIDLIEMAGLVVVVVYGAWLLSRNALSLGGLLVFMAYLSQLYDPVRGLSGLVNSFYAASASAERIMEFLDQQPSVEDKPWARPLRDVRGVVDLEEISFRYPDTEKLALNGVSLRIDPGETVVLVGASGAGKSTVAKLLSRFYDPDSGVVRLDGHDLRDLALHSLRENVSVLMQETFVFDGTVRENISYGKPGATNEEIVVAAKAADAHGFIGELPEGYETSIGQKGRRLSGGQRQRIAIARAVIRDAPVLILDEPTTGLDAASSRRIIDPLRRLMEDRTTIVISHDISIAHEANRVLVLEDGQLSEAGTAAELLSRNGAYANLNGLRAAATRNTMA